MAKVSKADQDAFKADWWAVFDRIEEPPGPRAVGEARSRMDGFCAQWERAYPSAVACFVKWFHFEGSEGLPLDHFAVILEASRERVLERAVPFRAGEEVHVEIVEPHMYSPGDAVAKVDGYMIQITGAGDYVGEKHMVRIEEAGRTSAVATLVDVPARPAEVDDGSENGDGLESKPRRRGRRGGRRRSGAKAESVSSSE